jgi:hypothetical protein
MTAMAAVRSLSSDGARGQGHSRKGEITHEHDQPILRSTPRSRNPIFGAGGVSRIATWSLNPDEGAPLTKRLKRPGGLVECDDLIARADTALRSNGRAQKPERAPPQWPPQVPPEGERPPPEPPPERPPAPPPEMPPEPERPPSPGQPPVEIPEPGAGGGARRLTVHGR